MEVIQLRSLRTRGLAGSARLGHGRRSGGLRRWFGIPRSCGGSARGCRRRRLEDDRRGGELRGTVGRLRLLDRHGSGLRGLHARLPRHQGDRLAGTDRRPPPAPGPGAVGRSEGGGRDIPRLAGLVRRQLQGGQLQHTQARTGGTGVGRRPAGRRHELRRGLRLPERHLLPDLPAEAREHQAAPRHEPTGQDRPGRPGTLVARRLLPVQGAPGRLRQRHHAAAVQGQRHRGALQPAADRGNRFRRLRLRLSRTSPASHRRSSTRARPSAASSRRTSPSPVSTTTRRSSARR